MIVIERTWKEPDPRGGGKLNKVARKCFADDDLDGVNKFINETTKVSGYEWTNVEYKYIKLKAKVIDKDYYTPDFEVGEVVEIMKGMETDTADIWNAPVGKAWLCKKQDGTFRYNIPLNLQIIESKEEHWQDIRERAAIAAMQGVMKYFGSIDKKCTIAKLAVEQADELIKQLKEK